MAIAHRPRRSPPSARPASLPRLEDGALASHALKATRTMSPLHRFRPVPGYRARRLFRACAAKRMVQAVSGVLNDKATAMRVLSLSRKPSAARSGLAVSTLIRKVSGLRGYRPGRSVCEAAMTNAGDPWPGRGVACPLMCSRSSWRALAGCFPRGGPWAPLMAIHLGSQERRWSRGLPVAAVEKKAEADDGGMVVACRLEGGGRKAFARLRRSGAT
jgi:hypothetical protein